MLRYLGGLCCVACGTEEPVGTLVIEHQPHHRAEATDAAWVQGSAIVATNAPSFPQPLLVRIRIVDDADADLGVTKLRTMPYGATQLQWLDTVDGCYYRLPDVAPDYCTFDYDVLGPGSSMRRVTARAPHDSDVQDCFYYGIVDASTDTEVLRRDLDAGVDDCRVSDL